MTPKIDQGNCQECGMHVKHSADYHPHLFCTLWKAYRVDPALLLAAHGYTRAPVGVSS